MGCEVTDFGIVPDRREATVDALREAARAHDLILTSGGVSVGEEDHVKPAVQALGQLDLWQIAIKPGKPFAYGRVNCEGEGLPTSSACRATRSPASSPSWCWCAPLCCACRACSRRCRAVECAPISIGQAGTSAANSCACYNDNGGLELFRNQSSGVLTSAAWGDGVVDNPPGQTIAPGDRVRFIAFSELMA
jgi:molybdopterin molybdotransferase